MPAAVPPATSSPRRSVTRRVVAALAVCLVCVGLVVIVLRVLGGLAFSQMVTDVETLTPAQIEAVGQFKVPPGAANIRSRSVSWLDYSLRVSFTLPPAEVGALLDSTRVRRPLSTTHIPFSLTQSDGWWNPGAPASFEAGSSEPRMRVAQFEALEEAEEDAASSAPTTRPDTRQEILIDKTNPQLYKVWLLVTS